MSSNKSYKNVIIMAIILFLYYLYPIIEVIYAKVIGVQFIEENGQIVMNISDNLSIILKLFADITFATFLIFYYKNTIKEDFKKLFKNFKKNTIISLSFWIIGLVIMALSNFIIHSLTSLSSSTNQNAINDTINTSPFIAFLIVVIVKPIIEELVFRKSLKDVFKNKISFILISGLFFGAIHIVSTLSITPLGLLYIIPYGALGICLSTIYYKTDSIFSSIFIHMLHNGLLLLFYIL